MGKRILGWLRQRPVVVAYSVLWIPFLVLIAILFWVILGIVDGQVSDQYLYRFWAIVIAPFLFLIVVTALMQIVPLLRRSWRRSLPILAIRLILIFACLVAFLCVLCLPNVRGYGFYLGQGVSEPELVSFHEVYFIYGLFIVGSLFQCGMIEFEDKISEVNKVIGGVLAIVGILVPKLIESWSLLSVSYGEDLCDKSCKADLLGGILALQMGIAYAVGLSVMLVIGLYAESIARFFRSCEEKVSDDSKKYSLDGSQNDEVTVSEREIATASDTQNDGVELGPGSSPATTCVPQETADGVVPPVCSEETSARPTVSLASSSVSRGDDEGLTRSMKSVMGPVDVSVPVESSSGSGSVAVSKRLMSAAVTGVVAGVCFSVASRLFSRR